MATVTMAQALNEGLRHMMKRDNRVILLGEDVGKLGGVFRITDKLQQEFGEFRSIDTPLAESGIVGASIGLAFYGFKPVCEMQFDGFTYPAFEQIVSNAAKYRMRTRSHVNLPIVIRIPYGGGIGAVEHHSESPEAFFIHTAGLKICTPSTPADAFRLIVRAIEDPDPVIVFEPKRRYWIREEVELPVADDLGIGKARVLREGDDVTLVAWGPMVRVIEEAAEEAAADGVGVDVIDLRWLQPWDIETVAQSVRKTGRLVVVHEASITCGFGAEIAARIMSDEFLSMKAPVVRVGGYDIPYPPSKSEDVFLPDLDRVLDALDEVLNY